MKTVDSCSQLNKWAKEVFQLINWSIFSFNNNEDILISKIMYDDYTPAEYRVIYKDGKVNVKSVRAPDDVDLKKVLERLRHYNGLYMSTSEFTNLMYCVIHGNEVELGILLSRYQKGRL